MKYIIIFFIALLYLPASGQPDRKTEIERLTKKVYSTREIGRIADSMQMSVSELSYYPVIFPIKEPVITSGYGMRIHPIYKVRKFHTGIDIAKPKGTPVYATGNGVVIRKGYCSGYGYFIEIQHTGGFRSFYAHLSKIFVNKGDTVNIGKHIACVGNSGVVTGCHLHYEIRKGNHLLNPIEWSCYLFGISKLQEQTNNK